MTSSALPIFPAENCYPDIHDLERVARSAGVEDAAPLYQQFRIAYEWLTFIRKCCRRDGKHTYQPIAEIQRVAEGFIGPIPKAALVLAIREYQLSIRSDTVKFPPLNTAEDLRKRWDEHISGLTE